MSDNENTRMQDGRDVAMEQQTHILRLLFRFGWLRTKDLACVAGRVVARTPPKTGPSLQPLAPSRADIRRVQRRLAALKERRLILMTQAPNGSRIYALSEKGARVLQGLGLDAGTGKELLRNYHAAFFLHRNIANEVAASALCEGFRVSTEREIAQGRWLAGEEGLHGKRPDVVVRAGEDVWLIEVERSHRNRKDYLFLLEFLSKVWSSTRVGQAANIAGKYRLKQVIFICTVGFENRLTKDLLDLGWSAEELAVRVKFEKLLYNFKAIAFY